ncbi:MAG: ATP-binding protein [Bacteroidales bacterium]
MRAYLIPLFIVLFLIGEIQPVLAQQFNFTYYTSNEGLPTDLLKAVDITPSGFPLIATDDGLVFFDGQHFRVFREPLPGVLVKFVHRLPDGTMMVSDDMGLSLVSVNKFQVVIQVVKRGTVALTDTTLWYPKLVFTDKKQRIWVTDNRTIYQYKDGKLQPLGLRMTIFPENVQRSFMLADEGSGYLFVFYEGGSIFRIQPDRMEISEVPVRFYKKQFFFAASFSKGRIWAAAREGLWEFRTLNGQIVSEQLLIPGLEFSWIEPLDKGVYLGGTWSQGLYVIRQTPKGILYEKVEDYAYQNVNHIKNDHAGNLWISSDNGLVLMQKQQFRNPFFGIIKDYIQALAVVPEGVLIAENSRIWAVAEGPQGFEAHVLFQMPGETILRVVGTQDKIWWSTAEGNIYYAKKGGKPLRIYSGRSTAIFILVPDARGRLWFCQDGRNAPGYVDDLTGKIEYPLNDNAFKGSRIISIAVHPGSGNLLLGGTTDDGYLWEYDPVDNELKNLSKPVGFQHNVPIAINDIAFARDKTIWLASSFGLLRLNGDGRVTRLEHENIKESAVKSVLMDEEGNLWFTLSLGLVKWDGKEAYVFSERDGLPSKTTSYRTLIKDVEGRLWVGTISGIAVLDDGYQTAQTPEPLLGMMLINGISRQIDNFDKIRLNKGDFLRLEFVTPAFPARSLIYRYRIVAQGDKGEWITFKNTMELFTEHLASGNYFLEIEARKTGNYRWSSSLVLPLHIGLKWYQNPWIISGVLLLVIFVIVMIVRYQAVLHQHRETELENIINERTREILEQSQKIERQNEDIIRKNAQLEATNKELNEARLKAEKLAQARSLFLSTISHELRTPLNAVIGMTYILLNENPRPDQVENLNTLKFSAENLLALINDILDYSKIDAGKLVFEEADFDIREKVHNVVQVLQVKAQEKGIKVLSELSPDIPDFVIGDPTRFNQILFNLAGNAVKFTHAGYVKIKLSLIERTATHVSLRIDVEDTGIGIPADKLPLIFESFSQAGVDITRKYGGTGLGLAITKSLVELQGGRIEVSSQPGVGSCFSVFISYRISSKVREKSEKIVSHEYTMYNGEDVLVVDDNQVNLIVASKFLTKWNLKVETAENGLEALQKFKGKKYALVLMDLQMPEMDGRIATQKIRKYEQENRLVRTPIFALTASALSDQVMELADIGIDDFITKPFNPIELNIKIQKVIKPHT